MANSNKQPLITELTAGSQLTIDSTAQAVTIVRIKQEISELVRTHAGLEGIGSAIADGHPSPRDTQNMGFAVAAMASHIETLVTSIEEGLDDVIQSLASTREPHQEAAQ